MRLTFLLAIVLITLTFVTPTYARSGCCSHHGGVCGCGCCDGSLLSSTCAPYYPQCNSNNNSAPVYIIPTATPIPYITKIPTPIYTPTPISTPTSTSTPKPTQIPTPVPTVVVLGTTIAGNTTGGLIVLGLIVLSSIGIAKVIISKGTTIPKSDTS